MLLPGYRYKEFAGDRAALFRTFASYRFGVWQTPIVLFRGIYIPGLSPGLVGERAGWMDRALVAGRGAVGSRSWASTRTGCRCRPRRTEFARPSAAASRFFSDLVHVGVARPVDHPAPWRFVVGFGTLF